MFCKECGTKLQEGASFCSKCGSKIDENLNEKKRNKFIAILILVVIMISIIIVAITVYYTNNTRNENMQYSDGTSQEKNIKKVKQLGQMEYVKENTKVVDDNGNILIIPEGFRILIDEGTTVQEGIVIQDIDGNEFVWIPIGEIKNADGTTNNIELARYTFNENGTIESKIIDGRAIIDEDTKYVEEESNYNDIEEFKISVSRNGGYYLARYEASYRNPNQPYSKKSTGIRTSENNELIEGEIWSYITQTEALRVSKGMYNNNGFKSGLVNSYAWDTAMVYIQKSTGDSKYVSTKKEKMNGGRYLNTGETGDIKCNIFDMAGNFSELTTEIAYARSGKKYPVFRTWRLYFRNW